jgi:glycosyltransferase involved in cell wall biosynthesis
MKILHINSGFGQGGASVFLKMLSNGTDRYAGVDNFFLVKNATASHKNLFEIDGNIKYCFGERKIRRILYEKGFINVFYYSEKEYMLKVIKEVNPDIIHLHNIHGYYFQLNLLKKISKIAPVVWTFHDMYNFTGHCAHSFDCEKWIIGCGKCPYLKTYPELRADRTAFLWKYKKKISESADFTIVAPSMWLKNNIEKSFLSNKKTELVYNGIETDKYKKTEKRIARNILNLPMEKKIILFSAAGGLSNEFKGGEYFLKLVDFFKNRNEVLFLTTGGEKEKTNLSRRIDYGYVESEEKMALLYSAADIYLYPTLADNCPLSVIEAMSCGLPIVTFCAGGVPEIVEHMKTGYVAEYKNSDDLKNGVEMLLKDERIREDLSINSVNRVKEKFSSIIMSEKYFNLYKELRGK